MGRRYFDRSIYKERAHKNNERSSDRQAALTRADTQTILSEDDGSSGLNVALNGATTQTILSEDDGSSGLNVELNGATTQTILSEDDAFCHHSPQIVETKCTSQQTDFIYCCLHDHTVKKLEQKVELLGQRAVALSMYPNNQMNGHPVYQQQQQISQLPLMVSPQQQFAYNAQYTQPATIMPIQQASPVPVSYTHASSFNPTNPGCQFSPIAPPTFAPTQVNLPQMQSSPASFPRRIRQNAQPYQVNSVLHQVVAQAAPNLTESIAPYKTRKVLMAEIEVIITEKNALQEEVTNLAKQRDTLLTEKITLVAEKEEFVKKMIEKDDELTKYKEMAKQMEAEKQHLHEELNVVTKQLNTVLDEKTSLATKKDNMEELLLAKEDKLDEFRAVIAEQATELSKLTVRIVDYVSGERGLDQEEPETHQENAEPN